MSIDHEIAKLQNFARRHNLSKARVASMIGMSAPMMSKFFDDDWNPTIDRVRAIKKAFKAYTAEFDKKVKD